MVVRPAHLRANPSGSVELRAELLDREADVAEDSPQRALGDITVTVHGTVVPRPSGWRMTWWLPLIRATLHP
jgi:hypothetical protein